jgi:ATP adenylyltransferase
MAEDSTNDEANLLVHRGAQNFVALNLYPYITGHLLIIPYQHIGDLSATAKEATDEMMDLAKRAQSAIQDVYAPHGFNLGMNLGAAAGAGIVDHIHLHILPRWSGDTNFMTTIADARVIPESLEITYSKLRARF